MKVLTYNIRLGLESSLRKVGEVLAAADADVVGLQEVGRDWVMGTPGDQLALLGQQLGLRHRAHAPALRLHPRLHPWTPQATGLPSRALRFLATPGPLARAPGARIAWYGLGLLSRWPILEQTVVRLPRRRDEQRVLLLARLAVPGGTMRIGVTHLAVQQQERLEQATAVVALLRTEPAQPSLLLGDLNDTPDSAVLAVLTGGGLRDAFATAHGPGGGATFPARHPLVRLDYVLCGPAGPRPRVCELLPSVASDHLPLAVELDW